MHLRDCDTSVCPRKGTPWYPVSHFGAPLFWATAATSCWFRGVTMLALKVEIDGEPVVVAGVEDWSILALHITGSRGDPTAPVVSARPDNVEYSLGGLTQPDSSGV